MFEILIALIPVIAGYSYKGITFTNGKYCPNVTFDSLDASYSLLQLKATGADSVAIVVTHVNTIIITNSTTIEAFYEPLYSHHYTYLTETDMQLEHIVRTAHSIGLKVMMKMHIDLYADDDHWRGDIGYHFSDEDADLWFESYSKAMLHYAQMSQRLGVHAFSVSCELIAASKFDSHWRSLIVRIRDVYDGQITSSSNWGWLDERGGEETHKTWWDAVDFIGVDAYYNFDQNLTNPTLAQLVTAWKPVVQRLESLSLKWNKKVVLTELGYCSGKCSRDYTPVPADFDKQALYYEAAFLALLDQEWFDGYFWWSWNSDPRQSIAFHLNRNGGLNDNCITPQNKKSEEVLRKFYGGTERVPYLPGPNKCACTV